MTIQLPRTLHWIAACTLMTVVQGDVLVVGPSEAHTTIQSAVDAASDGDVIRCQPGQYQGFTVSGKALNILAANPGNLPTLTSEVEISNSNSGQAVLLSGFTVQHHTFWDSYLVVDNCDGPVRLTNVHVFAPGGHHLGAADPPALSIHNCSNVSIADSHFEGHFGARGSSFDGFPGGHGVKVTSSKAAFYSVTMQGGKGGEAYFCCTYIGGQGGDGLRVLGTSEVFLADCALSAGQGGISSVGVAGGPSGIGLATIGTAPIVRVRGGPGFSSIGTPPILWTGQQPRVETRPYLLEHSALGVLIKGTPGARVGLYFGNELDYGDQVIFNGPRLVAVPSAPLAGAWRYLGTMPASGQWTGTFPTVDMPSLTHTTFHMLAVIAMGPDRFYSNSTSTVIADSAW